MRFSDGWLAREAHKVTHCRPVIEAAQAGDLVIVTSALTIAEVLWLRGQPRIPAEQARTIEAFFQHRWIVSREVDRFVAERARGLVWDHNVKPKDAIHLATALGLEVKIAQFDTFDHDLRDLSGKLGTPPLLIGYPNLPAKLPFDDEPTEADDEDGAAE